MSNEKPTGSNVKTISQLAKELKVHAKTGGTVTGERVHAFITSIDSTIDTPAKLIAECMPEGSGPDARQNRSNAIRFLLDHPDADFSEVEIAKYFGITQQQINGVKNRDLKGQ